MDASCQIQPVLGLGSGSGPGSLSSNPKQTGENGTQQNRHFTHYAIKQYRVGGVANSTQKNKIVKSIVGYSGLKLGILDEDAVRGKSYTSYTNLARPTYLSINLLFNI